MHQCLKFSSFWGDTLHVSDGLPVHHQEFKTVHTATGICQTDAADCRQQYLFDICLLQYVQSLTPDDGREDRPKHVECYSNKINLTLMHLVGFTVEIYYDARPYERQICYLIHHSLRLPIFEAV